MEVEVKKPPLGVMPTKFYWEACINGRIKQIDRAITDHVNAGIGVDQKWIDERNILLNQLEEVSKLPIL